MADVALLDRAFANIMQCFIHTGQAPHHTDVFLAGCLQRRDVQGAGSARFDLVAQK
jgi:hypothetical protein